MAIFGYVRISTRRQSLDRQIKNILTKNPKAKIKKEIFTGTKIEGREQWNKLVGQWVTQKDDNGDNEKKVLKGGIIKKGDTIIFDSVSRMSRNADEGVEQYFQLFDRGVELEFIKEPHIDTAVFREVIKGKIEMTGTDVDDILRGVNTYMIKLAKKQIRIAFEQAEKEVKDLQERTKETLKNKKEAGVKLGLPKGTKLTTKKSIAAKEIIKKHSKNFGGTLNNKEVIELAKINRSSFYKYQKELIEELQQEQDSK